MELNTHALDGQVSLNHFRFAGNEVQTFLMIIVAHDFPISLRDMTETLSHPHKVYSDGTFPPFPKRRQRSTPGVRGLTAYWLPQYPLLLRLINAYSYQ